MKTTQTLVLAGLLPALVLLAACGEIAFKRGAGADALQADQTACRAAGGDYSGCMNKRGWTMVQPGGMAAVADAGDPATTPAESAVTDVAPVLFSASTKKDNRDSTSPPPPPRPVARPYDPLAVYSVSSFWKRGAGREDLDAVTATCTEKLGEAHRPTSREGGGLRVTAAMLRCLREHDWYGLAIPS